MVDVSSCAWNGDVSQAAKLWVWARSARLSRYTAVQIPVAPFVDIVPVFGPIWFRLCRVNVLKSWGGKCLCKPVDTIRDICTFAFCARDLSMCKRLRASELLFSLRATSCLETCRVIVFSLTTVVLRADTSHELRSGTGVAEMTTGNTTSDYNLTQPARNVTSRVP